MSVLSRMSSSDYLFLGLIFFGDERSHLFFQFIFIQKILDILDIVDRPNDFKAPLGGLRTLRPLMQTWPRRGCLKSQLRHLRTPIGLSFFNFNGDF